MKYSKNILQNSDLPHKGKSLLLILTIKQVLFSIGPNQFTDYWKVQTGEAGVRDSALGSNRCVLWL